MMRLMLVCLCALFVVNQLVDARGLIKDGDTAKLATIIEQLPEIAFRILDSAQSIYERLDKPNTHFDLADSLAKAIFQNIDKDWSEVSEKEFKKIYDDNLREPCTKMIHIIDMSSKELGKIGAKPKAARVHTYANFCRQYEKVEDEYLLHTIRVIEYDEENPQDEDY